MTTTKKEKLTQTIKGLEGLEKATLYRNMYFMPPHDQLTILQSAITLLKEYEKWKQARC